MFYVSTHVIWYRCAGLCSASEKEQLSCVFSQKLLCSIVVNVIWNNQTKTKRKENKYEDNVLFSFPGWDQEGTGKVFFVPGWDSIPLEIEIGLQPFPNPWSMFSQYFRSSGEKTKSRSRICKPSELILIGEEISRNVNVRPSSPQVMVDSFATDSVFIVPSAWLQMLRGENLSTG